MQEHKFEYGDYFGFPPKDKFKGHGVVTESCINVKNVIWLPRQDQLQEMARENLDYTETIWGLHSAFFYKTKREEQYYSQNFTSMEQLWLAFVMKERYSKIWNGEEWILNENL